MRENGVDHKPPIRAKVERDSAVPYDLRQFLRCKYSGFGKQHVTSSKQQNAVDRKAQSVDHKSPHR
eukprot:5284460-Amphidinium_carterae.1